MGGDGTYIESINHSFKNSGAKDVPVVEEKSATMPSGPRALLGFICFRAKITSSRVKTLDRSLFISSITWPNRESGKDQF